MINIEELTLEIDLESGDAYLRTQAKSSGKLATESVDCCQLDFNEQGELVGIEMLGLSAKAMEALKKAMQ